MSTLTQVSELLGHHHHDQADARLILDFEARSKSRQRAQLADGEAVALMLPRGTLLRGGDWLRDDRGRLIEVVAASEWLSCVSGEPLQLLRAAYHLGNRHVALELQPDRLQLEPDHVLADMLRQMDLVVSEEQAPFEPEGGAYAAHAANRTPAGHAHAHAPAAAQADHDHGHGHPHDNAHGHVHGPHCDHDHH